MQKPESVAAVLNGFDTTWRTFAGELRAAVERELSERLNQAVRRLRTSANEAEWRGALAETAGMFCSRCLLFEVAGQKVRAEALNVETELAGAPAFETVCQSLDTVVALRSAGELSAAVFEALGPDGEERICLFPVSCRSQTAYVLYAEKIDPAAGPAVLELLALAASADLEARRPPPPLVQIAAPPPPPVRPAWDSLPEADRALHLAAQRFARVQAAEIRLYKPREVREGRSSRDLYAAMKEEIDTGREVFRSRFFSTSPSMVDYFHLELVRTLANDDVALLGPKYPGPLT